MNHLFHITADNHAAKTGSETQFRKGRLRVIKGELKLCLISHRIIFTVYC